MSLYDKYRRTYPLAAENSPYKDLVECEVKRAISWVRMEMSKGETRFLNVYPNYISAVAHPDYFYARVAAGHDPEVWTIRMLQDWEDDEL